MLSSLELSTTARTEMEEATALYAEQLTPQALEYLHGRGLDDEEIAGRRLGVVGDPLPAHTQYRGRLVIPYQTPSGVVALRFRALDDSKVKYLSMDGATPRLYNVAALHTGLPHVGIVEGEFKAIALTRAGLPTVGVPGAGMWLKHHPRCFADFARVYVIGDNDVKWEETEDGGQKLGPNPGQQLALKIIKGGRDIMPLRNAVNIVPPENVQVDEWIQRDGAEEVLSKIGVVSLAPNVTLSLDSNQDERVSDDTPPF